MANITFHVPDDVENEMRNHPEIKWTHVAREALLEKARRLRKLEILEKYLDHVPFNEQDLAWMDAADWHPVDERQLAPKMVEKLHAIRKGNFRKVSSLSEIG